MLEIKPMHLAEEENKKLSLVGNRGKVIFASRQHPVRAEAEM